MSTLLADQIVKAVKSVLPEEKEVYPLHAPTFGGKEWEYVKECIDTTWVSSVGKYVDLFEEKLAEYTGVKRAVAVMNGTAALHLALKLVGVKGGDEVLVPALSFVATANAVTYCGATPHFVDCDVATLGVDATKLDAYLQESTYFSNGDCFNKQTRKRIRAIVPMHTFGHPVEMNQLMLVAHKYHLKVVEDAAEGLGSFYKGKHVGSFGQVSALSFNGNKIITTGGGGAILTNDEELADQAKHLSTVAKIPHKWEYMHDQIGYNYRMPNINAALGCAQLEQLPSFLEKKKQLAKKYEEVFSSIEGVHFFSGHGYNEMNHWLNAILLDQTNEQIRDDVMEALHRHNIFVRPVWYPLNQLEIYRSCPSMNVETVDSLSNRIINLPSSVM